MKADPRKFINRLGDGEAAKEALERNLLANKLIGFFTIQTSFSTIRTVTLNFQNTAILKLPKLALRPLATLTTKSPDQERTTEGGARGI